VLRFTIRELLWLTLAVAITCGWWLESVRAHQWRQRAELAVGVLEAECLSRMVFTDRGAYVKSPSYDAPLREQFIASNGTLPVAAEFPAKQEQPDTATR
jgi:hypothetical protein